MIETAIMSTIVKCEIFGVVIFDSIRFAFISSTFILPVLGFVSLLAQISFYSTPKSWETARPLITFLSLQGPSVSYANPDCVSRISTLVSAVHSAKSNGCEIEDEAISRPQTIAQIVLHLH